MAFTLISLIVAFLIRLPALYVALTRVGYFKLSTGNLVALALFSTFLGVIMPPSGFLDIIGAIFRIVLLAVILMVLLRAEIWDALQAVAIAAIIESIILFALWVSPFSFLVAGLGILSVP